MKNSILLSLQQRFAVREQNIQEAKKTVRSAQGADCESVYFCWAKRSVLHDG